MAKSPAEKITDADTPATAVKNMHAATPADELLIWWTNEIDCRILGGAGDADDAHPVTNFPAYLFNQYRSRLGRNGRNRLWVSPEFTAGLSADWYPSGNVWTDTRIARALSRESYGGIVIKRDDLHHVRGLPGFTTDRKLNLVT